MSPTARRSWRMIPSIITNQRYTYINQVVTQCIRKKAKKGLSAFDKIDRVVTNRILAPAGFAGIMWLMYYISVSTVGGWMTDFVNDTLFGDWITNAASNGLQAAGAADWLQGLIVDGLIGGVGTVLGFVPQMPSSSSSRPGGFGVHGPRRLHHGSHLPEVRSFRKSFIPMLIGTGCGVPAVMAARTIEDEKDRRMTIMLCTFMPCSAKMVIIAMITTTFFPGNVWIAPAMYFVGIAIIVLSGISLKKTRYFGGDPAPFVMELPGFHHIPSLKGVLIHMWERHFFIIKVRHDHLHRLRRHLVPVELQLDNADVRYREQHARLDRQCREMVLRASRLRGLERGGRGHFR